MIDALLIIAALCANPDFGIQMNCQARLVTCTKFMTEVFHYPSWQDALVECVKRKEGEK